MRGPQKFTDCELKSRILSSFSGRHVWEIRIQRVLGLSKGTIISMWQHILTWAWVAIEYLNNRTTHSESGIPILLYTTDVYHWTNLIIVPLMFSAIVYYSVVFTDFTAASLPRHWRTMPRYFAGWNVAWLAMDVAEAEGYSLDECWPRVAWATYNFNYLCLILFIYIYIS